MNKGRVWKKWFRADASFDINFGPFCYPEAYYIAFKSSIFSSRYAVSQIHRVMAVNLHKDFVREWVSPTYGGIFDNVYWKLETLGDPDVYPTKFKFEIWHSAVVDTPLYSVTYGSILPQTEWGIRLLQFQDTVHFVSPDITVDPFPLRLTIQAARYDRYNP